VEGISDSDDDQTELPLANTGVSGDNTESNDNAEGNDDTEGNDHMSADDNQGSSQQKNAKVSSICL
jgi:hypothetical protein